MPALQHPLLYTFRRCPYAIRARLAIKAAGLEVTQHEVSLRDKPAAMIAISPKGTVPVLQLTDGRVIEESIDIMCWALAQHDPSKWLEVNVDEADEAATLIRMNDGDFKQALDRYKYSGRHPERPAADYRGDGERFLAQLEARLLFQPFLTGANVRWVDAAVFPFVRQFAAVDPIWFETAPYPNVRRWLQRWLNSLLFVAVMNKPTGEAAQPICQPISRLTDTNLPSV